MKDIKSYNRVTTDIKSYDRVIKKERAKNQIIFLPNSVYELCLFLKGTSMPMKLDNKLISIRLNNLIAGYKTN